MKKEKLTPEEEALVPVWREKYFAYGASTEPADRPKAEAAITRLYELTGEKPPQTFFWEPSPLAAMGLIKKHKGEKYNALNDVGSYGQAESYWVAFYTFCEKIGVKYDPESAERLHIVAQIAQSCGWVWPYEKACVVSDRPCKISWNEEKTALHCDGGKAVEFRDGWGIWALNGVQVPQWLAETPAEELPPEKFAAIENVEVRREFVRKIGVERMIQKLGAKTLDKGEDANGMSLSLLEVDLGRPVGTWRYLKMKNPSIGCWHVECVGQEVNTVQEANNLRASQMKHLNGRDWEPEELT